MKNVFTYPSGDRILSQQLKENSNIMGDNSVSHNADIVMSRVVVEGLEKSYIYTGQEIRPEIRLIAPTGSGSGMTVLEEGVHYTVAYQNNINKGTAAMIITGNRKMGYTGTKKLTYRITARNISNMQSDGLSNKITAFLTESDGNLTTAFQVMYEKGGVRPKITVQDGETILREGRDYTVSYRNNQKVTGYGVSQPVITIHGKGNYTGKREIYLTILPRLFTLDNGLSIIMGDQEENQRKGGYIPMFRIYDRNGKALNGNDFDKKNIRYTLIGEEDENGNFIEVNLPLTKEDVVRAGSLIQMEIKGKGNYMGTLRTTYRIVEKGTSIRKAVIQLKPQEYTAAPVTIVSGEQLKEGKCYINTGGTKKELILGRDIEVIPGSYRKNVERGTAKVSFRGIGNFSGVKTVSFKIGTRGLSHYWNGIRSLQNSCSDVRTC